MDIHQLHNIVIGIEYTDYTKTNTSIENNENSEAILYYLRHFLIKEKQFHCKQ